MHICKHKELGASKYKKLFKVQSPSWEITMPVNILENPRIPLLRRTNLNDNGNYYHSTELVICENTKIKAACKHSFRNYKLNQNRENNRNVGIQLGRKHLYISGCF